MDEMLKTTEEKILNLVRDSPQTISTIKRNLNLDYKNAWRYCRKLYDKKIVDLNPPPEKTKKGKPVYVILRVEKTDKDYILKILGEINKRKKITFEEYTTLFLEEGLNYSKKIKLNSAIFKLPFFSPKLIKREISLTPEGEKFLKDNTK